MSRKLKNKQYKKYSYMEDIDSDDTFYYIAGHTDGGAPFGITWEEIISQNLKLRQANKKDAKVVAELTHIAIDDIAERLTGKTKKQNIIDSLAHFFREEDNRLSYQNTLVADVEGEIAGIVVYYPGEEGPRLDEPFLKSLRKKQNDNSIFLDKEADNGDFYIDTLCVQESYRGYGIGTALIKEVERLAYERGYTISSLNVAHDNPTAKSLYKHLGYKDAKVIQINGHFYDYMVKRIR
ncbi:GNAT family N-acetyltransferase [Fredinandcohnia sp. 179-A 10B2 NHS]|uniref:GNAT family N-acetyltransferase n=1 Tax=Fredinandcohnia sp. 179-A 10B2 NHS TaxID=3235176 RepID=UPI00399FB980